MYERIKWRIQKETRADEIRHGGIFPNMAYSFGSGLPIIKKIRITHIYEIPGKNWQLKQKYLTFYNV